MFIHSESNGVGGLLKLLHPVLQKRDIGSSASETVSELATQWRNPSDVTSILMVIGGDVVQKALAQTTGNWFTPVCFSFGWVGYAFTTLVNIIGDGRLLPPPDYPVKVINLESGYCRENANWVVGRIVRDNSAWIAKNEPLVEGGMRITIFEAEKNPNGPTSFSYTWLHIFGSLSMIIQLGVASIPVILYRQWGILFITGIGTFLALMASSLPQWSAEKLPNRQASKKIVALTSGNGSKDIMIVKGVGRSLDLEELAVNSSPRDANPWLKFIHTNTPRIDSNEFPLRKSPSQLRMPAMAGNVPRAFWFTRCICVIQSVLWLLLLINVAGPKGNTWYLLGVGAIGMFQNAILAAVELNPKDRNLPLKLVDTIVAAKVMDSLMDLEVTHGWGLPLLNEFFPGRLRDTEKDWWEGKRFAYDDQRSKERHIRGPPRSKLPRYKLHTTISTGSGTDGAQQDNVVSSLPNNPFNAENINNSGRTSPIALESLAVSASARHTQETGPEHPEPITSGSSNSSRRSLSEKISFESSAAANSIQMDGKLMSTKTGLASFVSVLNSQPPAEVEPSLNDVTKLPYWG